MPEHVHVRYTKWDGTLHWHFDAEVIRRDDAGTWVVVPPGGRFRKGDDPPRIDEHGFVVLIPEGAWWTAYFNAVPRGANGHLVYVDVNTAATWDGDTAHLVDLDLDVVLGTTGPARVIDEDEFIEHRTRWDYPPDVVDRVRTTAASVAASIDLGHEPFASIGFGHVAERLGWAHGVVVTGHGVASGVADDARFPDGTIAEQLPAFASAGIPVDGLHHGTINLDLPFRLEPISPRATVADLVWRTGYPAETFSFFDARLAVGEEIHDVLVYRPHPETKPEFDQPATVVEILAPPLAGIGPGTRASLWVDPHQGRFDVA